MNQLQRMLMIDKATEPKDNYMRFLTSWKNRKKDIKLVYLFYEGVDDNFFYNHYVEKIYSNYKLIEPLPNGCEGKSSMNKLYLQISKWTDSWKKHPRSIFLFFCDRDYDELLETNYAFQCEKNLNSFTTAFYSIESYLIQKGVFARMLGALSISNVDQEKLKKHYEDLDNSIMKLYMDFAQKMLGLTLCVMTQRKFEKNNPSESKISLDKVSIKKLFKVTIDYKKIVLELKEREIEIRPYIYLEKQVNAPKLSFSHYEFVLGLESKFRDTDIKEFIRGKWFSKLLFFTYEKTRASLKSEFKKIGATVKAGHSTSTAGDVYASILHKYYFPEDLKQFLELNYNNIK